MSENQILSLDMYTSPVETKYYKDESKNKEDSLNFGQFILNFLDNSYWNKQTFMVYDDAKIHLNGKMFPGTQVCSLYGATVRIDYRTMQENESILINKIHAWGTSETIQEVKDNLVKKLEDSEIKES